MKLRILLFLVTMTCLVAGCVSTGAYPGFAESQPKIKKIAIIPPEVIVGHVTNVQQDDTSSRIVVRNEERESIYRQSVTSDQVLLFGQKGYQIDSSLVELFEKGSPEFKLNYLSFIRDYEYAAANASLPATTGGQLRLDANVQKALKPFESYTDADAFIFTRFGRVTWDPTSTEQHVLTAALFGFISADDRATLEIVCIERGTGKLLWRNGFSTFQEYFVHFKRLVDEFPEAARNSALAK